MRKSILAAALALGLAGAVHGQGTEIEGVIGSQIEAFKSDDFATAFTFASPAIRGVFGSASNFGRMVSEGYPMVWRPSDLEFLDLRQEARGLAQRVRIVDAEGRVHLLDYYMIETEDGWKINGVQLLDSSKLSA